MNGSVKNRYVENGECTVRPVIASVMPPKPVNAPPQLIRNYSERCLPEKSVEDCCVRLRQQGEMRLDPAKPWMPFTAVQTMSSRKVEFRWRANFKMAGIVPGIVVDCFENGRGQLDAWLLWFFRVAHAHGPKIDRSEIQRYLAEVVWCPLALINNESLRFQEVSTECVRISACDDETYVDLIFDNDSEIRGVKSLTRYRDSETQPWEGRFADYKDFGGVRLPTFGEVWWDAPDGRFVYWRAKVTAFEVVPQCTSGHDNKLHRIGIRRVN